MSDWWSTVDDPWVFFEWANNTMCEWMNEWMAYQSCLQVFLFMCVKLLFDLFPLAIIPSQRMDSHNLLFVSILLLNFEIDDTIIWILSSEGIYSNILESSMQNKGQMALMYWLISVMTYLHDWEDHAPGLRRRGLSTNDTWVEPSCSCIYSVDICTGQNR